MHTDILIFAVIAAFLIYRLNAVLGTRNGAERSRPNPFAAADVQPRPLAPVAAARILPAPAPERQLSGSGQFIDAEADKDGRVSTGLSEIAAADGTFEVTSFMQGARSAFEMIVGAYSKGDLAALKPLVTPKLYGDFASGQRTLAEAGHTSETIIHRIKSARLSEAHLGGTMAYLTVRFEVEETAFTKDKSGAVVSGNPDRIFDVEDIWTFTRDIRSADPNWTLIETQAVEKAA